MTRIVWTLDENIKLARQAALIRETNPRMSMIALAREAQAQVLTPTRQRAALVAASNIPTFIEQLAIAEKELKSARAKEARKAEAARIEQEQLAQQAADAAVAANKSKPAPEGEPEPEAPGAGPTILPPSAGHTAEAAPTIALSPLTFPADQLLPFSELETALSQLFRRAMFRAFTNETPPPVRAGVPVPDSDTNAYGRPAGSASAAYSNGAGAAASAEAAPVPLAKLGEFNMTPIPPPEQRVPALSVVPRPKHNPEPLPSPERRQLTRVVLFGLHDKVAQFIVDDFKGRFDIKAINEQRHSEIEPAIAGADLVLICVKFVAHNDHELIRRKAKEWARLKGGVTDVKDFLTQRWVKEQQQKQVTASVGEVQRMAM